MSLKRLRVVLLALPLSASGWSSGCMSSATGPSRELVDARAAYARAAASTATSYAQPSLASAFQTLEAAEIEHRADPSSARERHLAVLARERADLARAAGETAALAHEGERRRAELERSAQEIARSADAMKAQAEAARKQLEIANQQANKAQAELDAANREAQQREQDRQVALQTQIDTLRVERDQALKTVRDFASIQDNDDRGLVITMPAQVMFKTGSARLRPSAKEKLDELATALDKLGPDQRFVIEGHTDAKGSAAVNQRLSRRRAAAVREYLVDKGVDPDRIVARGRGEVDPVASNANPEGRAENRRVEIVVSPSAVSRR